MKLIALLFTLLPLASLAAEPLKVVDPWIRAAPPGARMLAAYATIENPAEQTVELVGASSDRFGLVEFHRTVQIDGVARMRQVEVLEVSSGEPVVLEPGGLHIMLMRPASSVTEGETISIVLKLGDGRTQAIDFTVRRAS